MNVSKPLESKKLPKRVLASVSGSIFGLQQQVCCRCGKIWWPRQPGRPVRCPACKSPYWGEPRRHKYGVDPLHEQVKEEAAVRADKEIRASEDRSFVKALSMLKDMKAAGRTWAEMAERVQTDFGVQLDKDQLKALVR